MGDLLCRFSGPTGKPLLCPAKDNYVQDSDQAPAGQYPQQFDVGNIALMWHKICLVHQCLLFQIITRSITSFFTWLNNLFLDV